MFNEHFNQVNIEISVQEIEITKFRQSSLKF